MKQTLLNLFLLFACAVCMQAQEPDLTHIRIKERPDETLEYLGKISSDIDAALDSLRKQKAIPAEITRVPLEVIFDYDDRLFFGITFGDCGNYSHVLDTKGNHYLRTWYVPQDNHRPFIEEGKVWALSWVGTTPEDTTISYCDEIHYFEGDTIVAGRLCKKLIQEVITRDGRTIAGRQALYESANQVFIAKDGGNFDILYDFATTEGSLPERLLGGDNRGTIQAKQYIQGERFHGWVTSITGYTTVATDGDNVLKWMEGVGYQGLYNMFQSEAGKTQRKLRYCTVGDEMLYYDATAADVETIIDPNIGGDVKKQWLDFTHVVKPRPKAPEKTRSEAAHADTDDEEETLKGEYSAGQLLISFKPLAGTYVVTITDADGTEAYHREVQTNNVVGINTNISTYAEGHYTINVENSEESYTASFVIGDDTAIQDPTSSIQHANSMYDLSGRRLSTLPSKGVFIKGRKKWTVK